MHSAREIPTPDDILAVVHEKAEGVSAPELLLALTQKGFSRADCIWAIQRVLENGAITLGRDMEIIEVSTKKMATA